MRKIIITILIPLILLVGVIWIFKEKISAPTAQNKKLHVVTTIFPLYDFTKNITGNEIDLVNLLPSNTGPHDFSVTPTEAQKIANADIIITNGVGDLEQWLPDLLVNNAKSELKIINTGEGSHLVETGRQISGPIELTETDPHIWLDPENAIGQIQNIARGLSEADPTNRNLYASNAVAMETKIHDLENEYQSRLAKLPNKDFLAFHNAFNHLAYRFNLNQAGVFEEFPGKEPTPKQLVNIFSIIKEKKIKTLFSEPQFSPKILETVAADLKLQVSPLNPLDTGDLTSDSYLKIMRQNLETLVTAFSQSL